MNTNRIETTRIATALSVAPSPSERCPQCRQRRCLGARKWCKPCILTWQRSLPPDDLANRVGTIPDACPDWRPLIPSRFHPAKPTDLPEALMRRIEDLPPDRGLFLWGPQGVGKTYAAAAAVKYLWSSGYDIAWQAFEELLLKVRDTYKPNSGTEWGIIGPLCEVEVLVLDDVGCTVSMDRQESDFSLRTFLVLLDHRLAQCRRTFVTSNKRVEDLGKSFDQRIASRLCEACEVIKIAGADRRIAPGGETNHAD